MGRIAFVFSGQGAQKSGMGKELYDRIPAATAVFDRLEAIRPGTMAQCFTGTEEELALTSNTQPCLYAVEEAAAAALTAAGIRCDMTAGFSLGEISALAYSGAVSVEDGFRLVTLRGRLMQADSEAQVTGMGAVVKLDAAVIDGIAAKYPHVYPVNYNSPYQTTVAGLKEELEGFNRDVRDAGGRMIPLKVAGGFHSAFMANAAAKFGEALADYCIASPALPLYSDYTAQPYEGDARVLLTQQICHPVRWQTLVENMIAAGADTFIELGNGDTLCKLVEKINSEVRTYHVQDCETLQKTIEEVKPC